MTWLDTLAVFAFQHGMTGDKLPHPEDPDLMGMMLDLDNPATGGVRHAVIIARHRDHAFATDPPFDG